MWQTITAIAVPLISVLIGLITGGGDTRLSRRIAHHIEILNSLEKHSEATDKMRRLVEAEIDHLTARENARQERKVNGANLSLAIIFGLGSAAMTLWLTTFITNHGRDPWAWVGIALISVGLALVAVFTVVGFSMIFNPSKDKTASDERK